ncbi:kinase-like domain-containing protein [Helicostylum pulchrum]|nr:kinase-like domain-containing protein [Helicostylum pulchrum]
MKDSFLLDFPSLSSLTITSKNEPIFLKEQTYSSSTIVTSNIEKKHFKKSHYGELQRRQIGTGASATVRLTHQIQDTGKMRVYAIKAFRKRKARETESSFMKKLISEFCISSTLDHINVVKTVDLVVDDKNRYCTVMEYCSGGDLYSFIKDGRLTSQDETNGYFKQLLNGLSYLHSLGVAHRDIKPENLLLVKQKNGSTTLKISDFGEADVFREAWQETSRLSDGLCGSTPYIAPEIFSCSRQGYRASQSDVWSAAIVYFSMRLNGVPFYSAQLSDSNYRLYQRHYIKASYPAFQAFDDESRSMIYAMLNPDPEKRFTIQDVLKLTWLAEIKPPSYLL